MSFAEIYQRRFLDVIEPAITAVSYRGNRLKATRVDLSKTGDSILTDIIDGIAHSVMVLADVSVIGYDSKIGIPYRNGNVMYEVGLALACRQSSEVLLIRDDKEKFLFDVSTIPHKHIDFSNAGNATKFLSEEIVSRLSEMNKLRDARIGIAISSMTADERQILAFFSQYGMDQTFWLTKVTLVSRPALQRLLDKQLIRTAGITDDGFAMFIWTELGKILADNMERFVPVVKFPKLEVAAAEKPLDPKDAT